MNYHWINLFNMIECDGPFDSIEAAKANAISVFKEVQNGNALHIGIGDDNGPICEGSIKDGQWIDGKPELTPTQQAIGERYRAMVDKH